MPLRPRTRSAWAVQSVTCSLSVRPGALASRVSSVACCASRSCVERLGSRPWAAGRASSVGLELPGWLTEPLGWIGLTWPEADEEKLFQAGQQWISFGSRLQGIAQAADGAANDVLAQNSGQAVEAFRQWWTRDDGPHRRMSEDAVAAEVIGAALHLVALGELRVGAVGGE